MASVREAKPGLSGASDETAGDVQDPVAQGAWLGGSELTGEQQGLGPGEQIGGGEGHFHPRRVRCE